MYRRRPRSAEIEWGQHHAAFAVERYRCNLRRRILRHNVVEERLLYGEAERTPGCVVSLSPIVVVVPVHLQRWRARVRNELFVAQRRSRIRHARRLQHIASAIRHLDEDACGRNVAVAVEVERIERCPSAHARTDARST